MNKGDVIEEVIKRAKEVIKETDKMEDKFEKALIEKKKNKIREQLVRLDAKQETYKEVLDILG